VIELTKNVEPEKVLADLYKRTPMQSTFSINLLALVDNEPRLLNLKQALHVYLDHRLVVIKAPGRVRSWNGRRRVRTSMEGYLIALKNLDEIISLIRSSPDVDTARTPPDETLQVVGAPGQCHSRDAAAPPGRAGTQEDRNRVQRGQSRSSRTWKACSNPKKMRGVASEELLKVKAAYGDRRRTQIVSLKGRKAKKAPLTAAELIKDQVVWIGMTEGGIIARTHDEKPPRLSGSDAPWLLVKANATDTLYLASGSGLAAAVAVHTLPEAEKISDGNPFNKQSPLQADELPVAAFCLPARKSALPEETCILTVHARRNGQEIRGQRAAGSLGADFPAGQCQ